MNHKYIVFNSTSVTRTLPVSQGLVDGPSEEHVQQEPLHYHQPYHPARKPEPVHVVLDEHGGGADLDSVGVAGRVLKEAVVWVEDLSREEKEELSRWPTIVKPGERNNIH